MGQCNNNARASAGGELGVLNRTGGVECLRGSSSSPNSQLRGERREKAWHPHPERQNDRRALGSQLPQKELPTSIDESGVMRTWEPADLAIAYSESHVRVREKALSQRDADVF